MMTTRKHTTETMKKKLRDAFRRHLGVDRKTAAQLLVGAILQDKAYELSALIAVMSKLKAVRPKLIFTLKHGTSLVFRAKGGPIQRGSWPFIQIKDSSIVVGGLWVDIECIAISAGQSAKSLKGNLYGNCHELDIVLVKPGTTGRPMPDEVFLGVEAKHREFNKALLKELLGVRREMTMRSSSGASYDVQQWFIWWKKDLPACPPSGLVCFCSSDNISKYAAPADFWGLKMMHLPA